MSIGFNTNLKSNKQNKKLQIPCDFRHLCILGRTGVGKTSSVITPILLERINNNHGIIIFDFKGNYHYTVKALAKKHGKLQDIIEIGNNYGSFTNIIEDLPVESLDKIIRPLLGDNKIDKFWSDSATQLGVSILAIIKYMNELFDDYEYSYNFKSLLNIASDVRKIRDFKKDVKKRINKVFNSTINYSKKLNIIKIIAEYYKNLNKVADDYSLKKMIEDEEKTILYSVMGTLTNPVASLSKDSVNISEIDVLEELTKGKIIIFSLNNFDQKVLNTIVASIFYKIIMFKMNYKNAPVTIIMDEAQKVLNDDFELPLDVLREYKVEVVLATQSIANLKEKLNPNKVEALLANLSHKIFLDGQDMEVPKYEAYYDGEYYKLSPIEFNAYEKFLAEREYQMNYTKLKDLSFMHDSISVVYSKYSDTKLFIKDQDLQVIGTIDFFPNKYTKKELVTLFPDILELDKTEKARKEYLTVEELLEGGDYDIF